MQASKGRSVIVAVLGSLLAVMLSPAVAMPTPPGFDIWLLPMDGESQPRNVTARPGYDNQPAFENETSMLFTRMMPDGQSDIARLDVETGQVELLASTPQSEYSPTPNPRGGISTVRVSLEGVQQLWEFDPATSEFEVLLPGIEGVGYHLWLSPQRLAMFIVTQPPELHVANLQTSEVMVMAENIGRSMQDLPGNPDEFAFVEPGQDDMRWIKRFNLASNQLTPIAPVLEESRDFVFDPQGGLYMASGKSLYQWLDGEWRMLGNYPQLPGAISRLAFSPSGRTLAMVVAETTE